MTIAETANSAECFFHRHRVSPDSVDQGHAICAGYSGWYHFVHVANHSGNHVAYEHILC